MEIGSFEGASRDKEAISVTSALTLSITPIRRRGSIDGRSNSAGTETMTVFEPNQCGFRGAGQLKASP
jgi:hypothetical protein